MVVIVNSIFCTKKIIYLNFYSASTTVMLTSGSDEVLCPFSFICILYTTKRIYLMCVNNSKLLLLYILVS